MIEAQKESSRAIDTKARILDAAETLFGEKGFEASSLRDITSIAHVNLAAVNYHFQSKESLIDAVIGRRIEPVTRRRMELLEAAGPSASVEQVVDAFIRPLIETPLTPVVKMMGRLLATPDQFRTRVFSKHLSGVVDRFRLALAKALPDVSEQERTWRLHFAAGVMSHVLCFSQLMPDLSGGVCDFSDPERVLALMTTFVASGLRAPATGAPEKS